MRRGSAQIESPNRRAVVGVPGEGAHEEELRQRHRPLEDVPARKPEAALEVERGEYLPVDHGALEVRRVFAEHVEATVREPVLVAVPVGVAQLIGRVLREDRHHVLSGGRHRRVHHRGNGALEDGIGGRAAVFGVVERLLHVIERGRDVDRAPQVRMGRQPTRCPHSEVGELAQRDVDLERRAAVVDRPHRRHELIGQLLRIDELQERDVRVRAGRDPRRPELGAVLQRHTFHPTVPNHDLRHRAVRPYFGASLRRGRRKRL